MLAVAVTAVLGSSGPALADPSTTVSAASGMPICATPPVLSAIDTTLDRTASRIEARRRVTIVAMGSSSTQGVGASSPATSYPSRLEQELADRFPGVDIRVINHGVGGQDVGEELIRLDRDVIAEHPDLVIWQVGTNAVLRRDDVSADEQLIARGVAVMKEHGIDVVLMDLQYAPRVLERRASAEMERLIAEIALHTHVGLFHRFEIMKEWDRTRQLAPAAMIGPDGLHMTDASYGCLANQLAEALAWNWRSHAKLAKSPNRSPDAIAGIKRSVGEQLTRPAR
jgi:lysophospholipase L1-like esterase